MESAARIHKVLKEQYKRGAKDYWMDPLVNIKQEKPAGKIKNGDSLFFCCRRGDRQRQLLEAFVEPQFDGFQRDFFPDLSVVPLVQFHEKFSDLPTIFPPVNPEWTLGETLSRAQIRQTRIAESEKAGHVTFFFNGRRVDPFEGEDWVIVPSPHSSQFLDQPATSTAQAAAKAVEAMAQDFEKHFILVNLAAGDIIGHLDDWEANVLCAEAVDKALTTICAGAAEHNYAVAVTADHGLLEKFVKADGSHNLSHTTSPVPFGLVLPPEGPSVQLQDSEDASLADVAPTLLKIMGISQPAAMTGQARSIPEGTYQRLVLVVLDGWGLGVQDPAVNPIAAARTPCLDQIEKKGPYLSLAASGPAVGLPRGRSGNSETGHLTLGAGRVIPQDELRIAQAVEAGELVGNKALNYGLESALARQGQIHFLLLLSERSSHGNLAEGLAVLKAAAAKGIKKAWLHLILDGRSSPPQASANLLKLLKKGIPAGIQVEIATAVGRSFALDRSGGYQDKTRIAYEALVLGKGIPF